MLRSLAFLFALLAGSVEAASPAEEAQAIAALRTLAADPDGPKPSVFETFSHIESTYLVDGLSRNQILKLREHIDSGALDLPANLGEAIRAKAPRPLGSIR